MNSFLSFLFFHFYVILCLYFRLQLLRTTLISSVRKMFGTFRRMAGNTSDFREIFGDSSQKRKLFCSFNCIKKTYAHIICNGLQICSLLTMTVHDLVRLQERSSHFGRVVLFRSFTSAQVTFQTVFEGVIKLT